MWNPAPFHPVEGYTSFLWVVLLREVWRFAGVEPPVSANVLSLLCGLGQVALAFLWLRRMPLRPEVEPVRRALAALALAGIVANRTFLAWLSSGLETGLFDLLFLWWLTEVALPARAGVRQPASWRSALAAALLALARPDGMLAVAATALLFLRARRASGAWPLLLPLAHLLWRRWTYGDWVPATYHAKVLAPWPTMGTAYATSFALEYGLLVWLVLAYVAGRRWLHRAGARPRPLAGTVAAVAVLAAHAAYYTLLVGGDHFEYRVYAHLVPVLFVTGAGLAATVARRAAGAVAALAAFVLLSWPIPWAHWALTRTLATRTETHRLSAPLAPHTPWPLRPPVALWDALQLSMISHDVGSRHQEHKVYCETRGRLLPPRAEGAAIPWDDRPIAASGFVGLLGWSLPNVAILDTFGLNDRTVARTPPAGPLTDRHMAHDRRPPPGYVECFRPNVRIENARVVVSPRDPPLRDDEIRACDDPARWLGAGPGEPSLGERGRRRAFATTSGRAGDAAGASLGTVTTTSLVSPTILSWSRW